MLTKAFNRSHRRSLVAFVLLAGLGLGVAITAATGARRSATAYDRLRAKTLAFDAITDGRELTSEGMTRLTGLPFVTASARFTYTPVAPAPLIPGQTGGAFLGLDDDFLNRVYRPLVLHGRLPRHGAADEVVINEAMAKDGHFHAGQRVTLRSGFEEPKDIGLVTVVGVVRGQFDVGANAGNASMLLSAAFGARHTSDLQLGPSPACMVRLRHGEADIARVQRAIEGLVGHEVQLMSSRGEAESTNRTLGVQTFAVNAVAALAFLATIVAAGQALARLLADATNEAPLLFALGLRPRQRTVLGVALAVPMALASAAVGVAVAIVASPRVPTGLARTVDPDVGVHIDLVVVLAAVGLWFVVLTLGGGALTRWARPARVQARVRRSGSLGASLPLVPRLGWQLAIGSTQGPAGVAARSALVATTLAVGGLVGVLMFRASLGLLLDDPSLRGWGADAGLTTDSREALTASVTALRNDPRVSAVAVGQIVDLVIDGQAVETYAFDDANPSLRPPLHSGRTPVRAGEIVLGPDTARLLRRPIGSVVRLRGPAGRDTARVVGIASFPEAGNNGDVGNGALVSTDETTRLGSEPNAGLAFMRLAPGTKADDLQGVVQDVEVIGPFVPSRVHNLGEVRSVPWLLAALLGLIGLASVTHALVRTVRTRRRELAILAALGAVRRELRRMVAWQATWIALLGIAVGLVGGVILGRAAWTATARSAGVINQPVIPWLQVLASVIAVFVVVVAVAAATARAARRVDPAVELRSA
jgi:ABC-type lipoprotein release transport system permease subunit